MSQEQNTNPPKVSLNLGAKEYIPKFLQKQNPNIGMGQQMNSPYMNYDMNNPYMLYQDYSQMVNQNPNFMQRNPNYNQNPNINFNQNPNFELNQNQNQNQKQNYSSPGIVGLQPKKNKKKKQQDANQQIPSQNTQNPQNPQNPQNNLGNLNNQNFNNQFNQMNLNNPNNPPHENKPKKEKKPKDTSQNNQNSQNQPKKQNIEKKKTDSHKNENSSNKKKPLENELIEDSFEGKMIQVDPNKKPMSIVFVGHVDAGKSTISGNLLYSLGQIDERIIEKYQREAKVKNRESWFMAYIMDINEEEREKGKTIEIGKAFFETEHRRFTLLDAPGHAGYIPNLLQGACQADFAGLVISAKKGEFEAGFDKSGSTREHTLLLKALGVNQLIVVVNKMDEESVKWNEERYNEIKTKLTPFLKSCGYDVEKCVHWIPLSGLNGDNLVKEIDSHKCPWYKGPYFTQLLDQIDIPNRDDNAPVRLPILDRYKENALYIMGKLESGTLKYGETYTLMPTKAKVTIDWLFDTEERGVPYAKPGENVRIRCKGIDNEAEVNRGYILCSNDNVCHVFNVFEAEIQVLELQEKQIITDGFICMLHFHTFIEECTIDIKCEVDRKTKTEKKVKFVRSQARIKAFVKTKNLLCGEKYSDFNSLGRFSMRYEGATIAIGKILRIKPYKKDDKKD